MALTSVLLRPNDASFANSQSAYSTYIKAAANNYDMTGWPSWRSNEHNSIMAYVPRSGATKVFCPRSGSNNVNSGVWNDANNWFPAGVPAANDKVLIGEGVTCTYNVTANSPDLLWIRQDGTINIVGDTNIDMLVDTWVATESALVQFGTASVPVNAAVTINIRFSASRGWIDVIADTFKQSRGFIWMGLSESGGAIRVYGAPKTHALRVVDRNGPLQGAQTMTLESAPSGWRVGDRIQIPRPFYVLANSTAATAGTISFNGVDHVATVTAINGAQVAFTPALPFSCAIQASPWADQQPRAWVRNLTRNVNFSTQNAANVPFEQWSHSMLMHTSDVTFEYAAFRDMGRTVKQQVYLSTASQMAANTAAVWLANIPGRTNSTTVVLPAESIIQFTEYNTPQSYPATFTFNGLDARGNAVSETFTLVAGNTRAADIPIWHAGGEIRWGRTANLYKTITSVTCSVPCRFDMVANTRSMRMTGSGIRIPINGNPTDSGSAGWAYQPLNAGSNIQGRYAFHAHRAQMDWEQRRKNATVRGCVVENAPGWGYAHHQSHYNFIDNIAYQAAGGGFVGERGDETGMWKGNHSSCMRGDLDVTIKDAPGVWWGDPAVTSSGFWWTGRGIKGRDNVADNVMWGYAFGHRHTESSTMIRPEFLDIPEILKGRAGVDADQSPIELFLNNEAFCCDGGINVVKFTSSQQHDQRTVLEGFFAWKTFRGMNLTYTGHYTLLNCTVMGWMTGGEFALNSGFILRGIIMAPNAVEMHVIRPRIDGFADFGLSLSKSGTYNADVPINRRIVVDSDIRNCGQAIVGQSAFDRVILSSSYPVLSTPVTVDFSRWLPSPKFITQQATLGRVGGPSIGSRWRASGANNATPATKTDRLGTDEFPSGVLDDAGVVDWTDVNGVFEASNIIRRDGFYVNTGDSQKYFFVDEIFSDRVNGEIFKQIVPCQYNSYSGPENRGSCTLSNTTPPVGANISVTCLVNGSVQISPLAFCSHPNSRPLLFRGCTAPTNGFIIREGYTDTSPGTGVVTYIPLRGFTGTDRFKYWVADVDGNISSQRGHTITVNVSASGAALVTNPDTASTPYETQVVFNVLTNDVGTGLTVTGAAVTSGGGSVSFASGGNITYTPANGFSGVATGTATVRDAALSTQTSTWSVFVASPASPPPNPSAPVAGPTQTLRILRGKVYAFDALRGASDPQGGTLNVINVAPSSSAVRDIEITPTGIVYFAVDDVGTHTLTYTLSNSAQLTATGSVTAIATNRGRRFGKI